MTDAVEVATALLAEARRTNERRLLVLSGERESCYSAARTVLGGINLPRTGTTLVSDREFLPCERHDVVHAGRLLGDTRDCVVLDCHDATDPNAIGRVVGTVDGGGLFVLLTPPLDDWPDRTDGFDERLAVPPTEPEAVTGRFRARLVRTLRAHPGIAIVDVDRTTVERDGLIDPAPRLESTRDRPTVPADHAFPRAAYEACLTADQADALSALESLRSGPSAIVVEADRGRGKSSAAGLAAGALAASGENVLVTAPGYRNVAEAFARAHELLITLDAVVDRDREGSPRRIEADGGGLIRFVPPTEAAELVSTSAGDPDRGRSTAPSCPDVVVVDEAAALPVGLLSELLAADRIAFATTVYGYEGTGRGFSVRFRDRLADAPHEVSEVTLTEPIRYAPGDPVEVWAFRALLLDARPPVAPSIEDADPASVTVHSLTPDDLLNDERLLGEAFGLLVLAHYRTEPADLARLLDGPNVSVRALLADGHVVCVALLAQEGGLSEATRRHLQRGGRIRGHMLPDVLVSQLRDDEAGIPVGWRVVRIATHHAVRSRGLGSHLLDAVREEAAAEGLDWIGAGFGATPGLVEFWRDNGYGAIHLSTTRNETSGEHSVLVLDPLTDAGRNLHDRHARWFADRIAGMLTDTLSDVDPDIVRAVIGSIDATSDTDLSVREWTLVVASAYGPGSIDVSPEPFRRLTIAHLLDPQESLSAREERLLVMRVLQAHPWDEVADRLDYVSPGQCMRALGEAVQPLVDRFGDEDAQAIRDRYE